MDINELDFDLPLDRIAQHPADRRDHSRLMVLDRRTQTRTHALFADLPKWLKSGDLLVRNNTKVVPARLIGQRELTGGRWEGLYLQTLADQSWEVLATTRGNPKIGEIVVVGQGLRLRLEERLGNGRWRIRPVNDSMNDVLAMLENHGEIPLPPYIRKGREGKGDRQNYQTTYAQTAGSVAAPTAGLHFTPELFDTLKHQGVDWVDITLHVGIGTFRPIQTPTVEEHQIHSERAELSLQTADRLNRQRQTQERVIAVGTTSTRTLEAVVQPSGFSSFEGEIDLFIRPGHVFQAVNGLITNFHLPRSSLLALVAAFAGLDFMRDSYREAIQEGYRFYSYGDAMLIL